MAKLRRRLKAMAELRRRLKPMVEALEHHGMPFGLVRRVAAMLLPVALVSGTLLMAGPARGGTPGAASEQSVQLSAAPKPPPIADAALARLVEADGGSVASWQPQVAVVPPGASAQTVVYGRAGGRTAYDVYWPAASPPADTTGTAAPPATPAAGQPRGSVLLIHGGAWVGGSRTRFTSLAVSLARAGYVAATVDYRLAPAARWPAQRDDVFAAIASMRARAKAYGLDPRRIVALGESAGGQLAMIAATAGRGRDRVAAAASWSGISDLTSLVLSPGLTGCRAPLSCQLFYKLLLVAVVRDLFGCFPITCGSKYRDASPTLQASSDDAPIVLLATATDPIVPANQTVLMDWVLNLRRVQHWALGYPSVHGLGSEQLWAATWALVRPFADGRTPLYTPGWAPSPTR